MDTTYPDDNKVLLVIADGNVTGKGEKMSTPDTLAKLLGFKQSHTDRAYECNSIGELPANRAKIYYGTYVDCGRVLKYIVIAKAENRGKRDSQLLITVALVEPSHRRTVSTQTLHEIDRYVQSSIHSTDLSISRKLSYQ